MRYTVTGPHNTKECHSLQMLKICLKDDYRIILDTNEWIDMIDDLEDGYQFVLHSIPFDEKVTVVLGPAYDVQEALAVFRIQNADRLSDLKAFFGWSNDYLMTMILNHGLTELENMKDMAEEQEVSE